MAWIEALLALAALLSCGLAAIRLLALEHDLTSVAGRLRRNAAVLVELQSLLRTQQRLADAQQLTEAVIDTGTSTVRTIHLGIARIPFGILEAVPATRDATRAVRQAHDAIANAVYGAIRGANRIAGRVARGAIDAETPRKPHTDRS